MILREGAYLNSLEIGNVLREAFYISTSGEAVPPKISLKPVYKLRKLCLANNLDGIAQIETSLRQEIEKTKLPKFNRDKLKSEVQSGHKTTIGEFVPKSESLEPFLTERVSDTLFNSRLATSSKKKQSPFKTSQGFLSEVVTNSRTKAQQVDESWNDDDTSFDFINGNLSTLRDR